MASKNNINSVFTDIANSIRAKKGTTNTIQPINMAEEIDGIPTGITPTGKIEITNTEEINVTNYETAQVVDNNLSAENIKKDVSILGVTGTFEGGGEDAIFKEAFQPAIDDFNTKFKVTYNKTYDTTDNITLYSPAGGFNYYFITKKNSSGEFRVIWTKNPCVDAYTYSDSIQELKGITTIFYGDIKFNCLELEANNKPKLNIGFNKDYAINTNQRGDFSIVYASNSYTSIEDCIEALKSNTTQYNLFTNTSIMTYIYENNTPVIITNGIEVGKTTDVNACGRQLSSNETIVVM